MRIASKIVFLASITLNYGRMLKLCGQSKFKERESKALMVHCIAECLQLVEKSNNSLLKQTTKKPCSYHPIYGTVSNITCPEKFVPSKSKDKKVLMCDHVAEKDGFSPLPLSNMTFCDILYFRNVYLFEASSGKVRIDQAKMNNVSLMKEEAQSLGIKVVLSIGSYDTLLKPNDISSLAGVKEKRANFVNSVVELVKSLKFDGLILSWLYPGCPARFCGSGKDDAKNIVPLITELGTVLMKDKLIMICYTMYEKIDGNHIAGDYFSKVVDFVDYFVMECPFQVTVFSAGGKAGLNFNTKVANEIVAAFMKKTASNLPARKLVLGFSPLSLNLRLKGKGGLGEAITMNADHTIKFTQVCRSLKSGNFTQVVSPTTQNYAISDKYFMTYDDFSSLKFKVEELIFKNDLAGVLVLELNQEDLYGECGCGIAPYTRMIAELLKREDCTFKSCF